MAYIVYKISGENTKATYYGYMRDEKVNSEADIVAQFMIGAKRPEDRGDVRWYQDNECGEATAEIVDIVDTEVDAWVSRNECRDADSKSITGATILPVPRHDDAEQSKVSAHVKWYQVRQLKGMAASRYDFEAEGGFEYLKGLAAKFGRDAVVSARNTMTVEEFIGAFAQ